MGVPENIDALLERFDITQETLARIAGVSQSSVSNWRRDQMPRVGAVNKICEHFGLTWDDIMSNPLGLAKKEASATNGPSAAAADGKAAPLPGIAANIKALRKRFGVTQRELAEAVGVTENAVSKWETGYSVPRMGAIEKIATHYGVTIRSIVDDGGMEERSTTRAGDAGLPLLAMPRTRDEDELQAVEGLMSVPYEVWRDHPSGYFLKAKGQQMNRLYPEGSLVLVDPDVEPSSGSVVVARVDGADYVMRRLYKGSSVLVLSPDSWEDGYEDIVIAGDDHTVEFVGSVVWFQASGELE